MDKLVLPSLSSKSPLVSILKELDDIRKHQNNVVADSTPSSIVKQFKALFHKIESLASTRIEGNQLTVTEYLLSKPNIDNPAFQDQVRQVSNIEKALAYIDENLNPGAGLTGLFVRELQQIAVDSLMVDGDTTAGSYRTYLVYITNSGHVPPLSSLVPSYMDDLISFVNEETIGLDSMIKVAMVHQKFVWIHPFGNGNGRTARLLTYALLVKYGINRSRAGQLLMPSAFLYKDKIEYFDQLENADKGDNKSNEEWSDFFINGVLRQWQKLSLLTQFSTLVSKVLMPALEKSYLEDKLNAQEFAALKLALNAKSVSISDVSSHLGIDSVSSGALLKCMQEARLIEPTDETAQTYTIRISSPSLLLYILEVLGNNGFIPTSLLTKA